ncbi:MAG: sialate O-acetylesterase [Prevotellaceae bacterium]|nr:sialate O-acetylesterase [Prevotellaceae bacterium]
MFFLTLLFIFVSLSCGAVNMPQLFQSGMVLQRQQPLPVWGTAQPGEEVTVTFRGKKYSCTADNAGNWRVVLPKQKPGGPFVLQAGDKTITDVMVGDVWICSGQSNVDTNIERVYPQYAKDIDAYSNEKIRLFRVQTTPKATRQDDVPAAAWKPLTKENAWSFTALGYFLAQRMYEQTGVPQGVIQSSLGGSPIQAWLDIDSLRNFPATYYNDFLLNTDPQYVEYQEKANKRANDVWFEAMNSSDPGLGKYEKADYDDSAWPEYSQYDNGKWARHEGRPIIGSVWLRQHVRVDAVHAGQPATLNLGTLHDMDYTFVNGKQVGVTYYQYPPRRYKIPAGLLREGDNVIAMRIVCKTGMVNFYKDKPHEMVFEDGTRIGTSLTWRTNKGSLMMTGPLGGTLNVQNQASMLYNGMIHPLAPYAVSGVVWYQGESNTGRPQEYGPMLRKLIGGWRALWQREDMPFCVVQLANYMEPTDGPQESGWAALREQQRLVCAEDPNAALAVAIDLGEAADIHPLRKRELAERCAMAFSDYLLSDKKRPLSPMPLQAKAEQGRIVITMDQTLQPQEKLMEFELHSAGGKFRNVKATTDGNRVIVPLEANDKAPFTIRYAWKNNPARVNLYNQRSLPASPFQIEVE